MKNYRLRGGLIVFITMRAVSTVREMDRVYECHFLII